MAVTVINGSTEVLFLPHNPLEEGLCTDLTHTGIVCKIQPWQEWWLEIKLAQLHSWVKRTMHMPKPKGIRTASERCHPPLCPSDTSSVSFSKS